MIQLYFNRLQILIEGVAEMVEGDFEVASWLVRVPPSDVNFKPCLEGASAGAVVYSLALIRG